MSPTRNGWFILVAAAITLIRPASVAARQTLATSQPSLAVWLETRTARLAPGGVTSPVGLVLERQSVVQANLRSPTESVLFLAVLRGGKVVWQSESRPFKLDPEVVKSGVILGRLLPGEHLLPVHQFSPGDHFAPGDHFDVIRDQVATHYASASRTVSASSVAASPSTVILNGIFARVPRPVIHGRVLLVAVLPASAAQRLAAPVRPMLVGGL